MIDRNTINQLKKALLDFELKRDEIMDVILDNRDTKLVDLDNEQRNVSSAINDIKNVIEVAEKFHFESDELSLHKSN